MNKTPTVPITAYEFEDLIKALELDREGISKLCGVKKDAPGWWRFKQRIPVAHLQTIARELRRKHGKRAKLNPVQQRAMEFLRQSQTETGIQISKPAIGSRNSLTTKLADLSKISRKALVAEIERRGGKVSFAGAKEIKIK